MFQVREKWFSSLMRIPYSIVRRCEFDKLLTKVSLTYLRNFTLLNLERDTELGCSRLLFVIIAVVDNQLPFPGNQTCSRAL